MRCSLRKVSVSVDKRERSEIERAIMDCRVYADVSGSEADTIARLLRAMRDDLRERDESTIVVSVECAS